MYFKICGTFIFLLHFPKSIDKFEVHRNIIVFASRILPQVNFLSLEYDTMRVRGSSGGHAVPDFWPSCRCKIYLRSFFHRDLKKIQVCKNNGNYQVCYGTCGHNSQMVLCTRLHLQDLSNT